ncbi:MAG: outer membrane beta-barrel protein [Bdellovibrionota bacterium]
MKRLVLILMALLTTTVAQAQRRDSAINSTLSLIGPRSPVRSNMQLWVVGSGGLSQLAASPPSGMTFETKNHDVYGGGILFEAGRFAMTGQTGLLYFQEGMNATATEKLGTHDRKTTAIGEVSYIGIPAVGRWNAVRKGRTRLSLGLGLMPAFVVSRNAKMLVEESQNGVVTVSNEKTATDTSQLRSVNVMSIVSIGGDIGLNRNQDMRLEVVYRRGLMGHAKDNEDSHTNSVVMNLGFGFDI